MNFSLLRIRILFCSTDLRFDRIYSLAEDTQSEESVDLSEQDHCHSERSRDLEAEVPESVTFELVAFDRDY